MKLSYFVSGSSLLLLGWLALTFVSHVPSQRYQKPDHTPTTMKLPDRPAIENPTSASEGVVSISVSQ